MNKQKYKKNTQPVRMLTDREIDTIVGYHLHPNVEEIVRKDWASCPNPRINEKKNKEGVMLWTSRIINYLLPILLWLSYIDPKHMLMISYVGENGLYIANSVLQIGIVLSWINIILILIIMRFNFIRSMYVRLDPWNPMYLYIWKGKSLCRICIHVLLRLVVVIGFAVNGYYILATCITIAYISMYLSTVYLRNIVGIYIYPYMK
jgi:hypothetical protein